MEIVKAYKAGPGQRFLGEIFYSIDETAHPSVYHVVSVYLSQLDNDNMKIAGCAFLSIEKKNLPIHSF